VRTSFRTKVFVAAVAAAAVSLAVVALLLSWQVGQQQRAAIAQRLTQEARLIADLLAAAPALRGPVLDGEANRLGQYSESRVTLIAEDGRVVGDSTLTASELPSLDNHLDRPEVIAARDGVAGISQRYSTTVDTDFLYVSVRAAHPEVRFVRLALPLTEIEAQLAGIRALTLVALAAAVPVALIIAWAFSAPLGRRVRDIAAMARRYTSGDVPTTASDYGSDELGAVARVLEASARELAGRVDELSRDRARTEAILSGMVEGVLVVDREGRLQLANRAAQEMLRIDTASQGRKYLEAIRHPDIAAQLAAALKGDAVGARELSLSRDPGRTFVARAAAVAASGGGGAVLVLHDVSDLRSAERIRRDFVANVSHELRTPLTAIRGYLEALEDETAGAGRSPQFLEVISRQTRRMERLVADLLHLARLDARQEALDLAPCDVTETFRGVVDDLAPVIADRHQRVLIDPGAHTWRVDADPAKLHDILRNLVENAVNHSPEGTEIRLDARAEGDAAVISVIDAGPGIPPADLTRVFERFYRVDRSRSRPGTGLGLAIVKHLVGLHGGRVEAANRPEGGAVFTVTLPLRQPPPDVTPN
jgi:two-component system phosphate regulon sensor histidine kinase PhoR